MNKRSNAVERYFKLAKSYCDLVERKDITARRLLRGCVDLLPELFCAAIDLPAGMEDKKTQREMELASRLINGIWPLTDADRKLAESSRLKGTVVTTKQFFALSRRLGRKLGRLNVYREIFHPFTDRDFIETTLCNDLAEIWHDVKQSLMLYQHGSRRQKLHAQYRAAGDVRIHWGKSHFTSGMKTILYALNELNDDWQFEFIVSKRRTRKRKGK
jgi:hypothetical protein